MAKRGALAIAGNSQVGLSEFYGLHIYKRHRVHRGMREGGGRGVLRDTLVARLCLGILFADDLQFVLHPLEFVEDRPEAVGAASDEDAWLAA